MRFAYGAITAVAALLLTANNLSAWRWPGSRPAPRIPADNAMGAAKVELGRRLFYDADLSADGSMACSTCHVQRHAFADSTRTRPGVHGDPGKRNVPGLANVAWMRALTWADPRLDTLEKQALVPVLGTTPVEMGMHGQEAEIIRRLTKDSCYVTMFRAAFPEADGRIDMGTIAKALATFQRTMVSDDAPYDRWRRGQSDALASVQVSGAAVFARSCASCHSGPDLSDGKYHRLIAPTADQGLGEVTGNKRDQGRFRTPSLRNLSLTGPYLHDGSAATVREAVDRHMLDLNDRERDAVLALVDAFTDQNFVRDRRFALPDMACGKPL